jgi:hypothetical protein
MIFFIHPPAKAGGNDWGISFFIPGLKPGAMIGEFFLFILRAKAGGNDRGFFYLSPG